MDKSTLGKVSNILTVTMVFIIGITLGGIWNVYAQNQTTPNAPIVVALDQIIYTTIIPIILSILAIVKGLVDKGYLKKEVGAAAVMAADATHAVGDTRQVVKDLAQNSYDVMKIASPEMAQRADQEMAPVVNEANEKLQEYKPKIDKFAQIANSSHKADKIDDMKDDIPNEIVPS